MSRQLPSRPIERRELRVQSVGVLKLFKPVGAVQSVRLVEPVGAVQPGGIFHHRLDAWSDEARRVNDGELRKRPRVPGWKDDERTARRLSAH